jgi:peptidoglycan/xylan/chitin deacetylase (PgdA/CDA1 family)
MGKNKKHTKQNSAHKKTEINKRQFSWRDFVLGVFSSALIGAALFLYAQPQILAKLISTAQAFSVKAIFDEDDHTDGKAMEVVTTEQEKLARMKNSSAVSWEMKDDPQFVVFAFDGSKSIPMWEETRAFARTMRASSTSFAFTYFINPIYLITEEEAKATYLPPGYAPGNSAIGYSESDVATAERRKQISLAQAEGNEIGSHAVGHFDGSAWNYDQWKSELGQFDTILHSTPTIHKKSVVGFRAPQLGQNENLFTVLRELGYEYDTSLVGYAKDLPKAKNGLWEFPVATVIFGKDERPVLSMDYSIYVHQTSARSIAVRDTILWNTLYDEAMTAYRRYFEENYTGNHAPVYIAHHFSKWNDGLYWQVMQDFARETCIKPNVRCVSYAQLAQYLDNKKIVVEQ